LAQTHVENLTHTVEDLKATRATLSKVLEQAERHLHNVKEQNKILTQKLYRLQMAPNSSKYDQLNNFLNTAGKQGCDRIANPKGHISKESRSK
jgi:exoribonuclease R